MIVVNKKKGEPKDTLFRKFSKSFKEDDIIFEVNRKVYFKRPGELKKEKERERIKRRKAMHAASSYGKNILHNKT